MNERSSGRSGRTTRGIFAGGTGKGALMTPRIRDKQRRAEQNSVALHQRIGRYLFGAKPVIPLSVGPSRTAAVTARSLVNITVHGIGPAGRKLDPAEQEF
jgi:hypothetical protein